MTRSSKKIRVMIVFGTRPEVIKLGPVVKALGARGRTFSTSTCFTAQHRQMCDPLLRLFAITPDYDLDIMTERQSLKDIVTRTMQRLDPILAKEEPDMVIVQGDTTSAFAAALVAFYRHISVGHVEAGLRTRDLWNPYPEELNRQLISRVAELNFAPTARARRALLDEGVPEERIFITGNTVIDALKFTVAKARARRSRILERGRARRRLILVTAHRRESFGTGIAEICAALLDLVERNEDLEIFLPVHPNPAVKRPIERALSRHPRITLSPPLEYLELVRILERSSLVLTDSGGLQEEAPALGKPVVVMRDETERPEIVEAGGAVLAGPHRDRIVKSVEKILHDPKTYARMAHVRNPFGDGHASERIAKILDGWFSSHGVDTSALRRRLEYVPAKGARPKARR